MNVTVEQITEKLRTLPENFLEKVWGYIDGLSEEEIDQEIPDWQKSIVEDRVEAYRQNPDSAIDIEDFFEEIEKEFE